LRIAFRKEVPQPNNAAAALSRCNWFVVDGVEDDFSLIGGDFLVSDRGVVHVEHAACTGEIFCAAGNGVDALAFGEPAGLGVFAHSLGVTTS
jgi:hypothetical protein